mmetsp:Transcript_77989/g.170934  ORF Transcript_77989/g.170934 Transcript_77989/m.170934 type:complete len:159 (+) Transcript_77989:334-810(+)
MQTSWAWVSRLRCKREVRAGGGGRQQQKRRPCGTAKLSSTAAAQPSSSSSSIIEEREVGEKSGEAKDQQPAGHRSKEAPQPSRAIFSGGAEACKASLRRWGAARCTAAAPFFVLLAKGFATPAEGTERLGAGTAEEVFPTPGGDVADGRVGMAFTGGG